MPNYKYLAANLIDIGDDTTGEQRRLRIGKNNDLALYHYASNSHIENLTGNLVLENKSTTGKVQIKLGTTTANTDFEIVKSDGTSVFNVDGSGGVSIPGSLTTGTHVDNSTITDLIIELGNGRTGDPSGDCGIVLERGDADNAFMGFDDSEDKFIMGTGEFTGATSGDLTITPGTLQVAGITRISTDEAHDLTIALAGNTDSSLVLSSTGTGADALQVTASAGGMDISSVGAIGMDTVGTAAINIGTQAAAKTITIGNDASTKVDINALAIELDSAAAMTLSSVGAIGMDTVGTAAINIGTEAAAKTITIGNDASTKVDINALAIELDTTNGVTVSGDLAVSGSARLGFKRYAVYTVDLSTLDGSVTAFTDEDVIFNLGALDVTTPAGITASQIIIEKAIFNVKTVADTALNVKLHLSSDAGTAVNTELENDTEMVGAGATYAAGGSTAADINLNSAAVSVITSNSSAAIAQARLYVVTTTALSANVTQGTVNISVEYSVI